MKDTILKLEPEVNQLNLGESMDRLLSRISNRDSYYENQLSLYKNEKIASVKNTATHAPKISIFIT